MIPNCPIAVVYCFKNLWYILDQTKIPGNAPVPERRKEWYSWLW